MNLNLNYEEMSVLSYTYRNELPPLPGIYYLGNHHCPVMYIGCSHNLKKHHLNHHRLPQFETIDNLKIYYQTLPQDFLALVSDIRKVLARLEHSAKAHYQPPLNNTNLYNQSNLSTSPGSIYALAYDVKKVGFCQHFEQQNGDELAIHTSQFSIVTKSIQEERPIFLIAVGTYEDYQAADYPYLSELLPYAHEEIYLLVSRFVPYGYEDLISYNRNYLLYGTTSKIFIKPYLILNNRPRFAEFKKNNLNLEPVNCEHSPFSQDLMKLGGLNLLPNYHFIA